MSDEIIKVPDIGSGEAEVIEICVNPGDSVAAEDSLIVLESDKATMEVPSPQDGVVTEVLLKVGDSVSEGAEMVKMAAAGVEAPAAAQPEPAPQSVTPAAAPAAAPGPAAGSRIEPVTVPDIGAENVPVIEVCVSVGDTVAEEDSLIVLESDKATMEVPSPVVGVVKAIHVKDGDALNQGDLIIDVEVSGAGAPAAEAVAEAAPAQVPAAPAAAAPVAAATGPRIEKVTVPDIGAENVPVIEVCVSVGESIEEEGSLIVLESDKATMDVPSPYSGVVKAIVVKEGDILSQGDLILDIEVSGGAPAAPAPAPSASASTAAFQQQPASCAPSAPPPRAEANSVELERTNRNYHAGPAVRKLAREFGVDLAAVSGSGPRRRILKEDVQKYVKSRLSEKTVSGGKGAAAATSGLGIPQMPEIDFSKWGDIEEVAQNRLSKVAAQNFQRSWL
ncbi:MAG: biotin/lipoyl-containing protein, partial [Endozoicomonas sp.]